MSGIPTSSWILILYVRIAMGSAEKLVVSIYWYHDLRLWNPYTY